MYIEKRYKWTNNIHRLSIVHNDNHNRNILLKPISSFSKKVLLGDLLLNLTIDSIIYNKIYSVIAYFLQRFLWNENIRQLV